jgi:DNA topoisomerase I
MNNNNILVIVESPGKINKIKSILGPNYNIIASVGHIIDLNPKSLSIEIENEFNPIYNILPDKQQVITNIKNAIKTSNDILIATDEDREGEMIAWSIAYILKLKNPKRITFNSITKTELLNAIKNHKKIDVNLVNAQKTRRILDRIVGYEISPLLWKNIKMQLSAGRVQSVVVKLIIDKENEIKKYYQMENAGYFIFDAVFNYNDIDINSYFCEKNKKKYNRVNIFDYFEMKKIFNDMIISEYYISDILEKKSYSNPPRPFTTSTLQQESNRKNGFSIKKVMMIAQKLYENGYITYMRTDSENLSNDALDDIKKYILDNYNTKYHKKTIYKTKNKNTQEAHEAIRPTNVFIKNLSLENNNKIGDDEYRLYDLIWKRTIASQMSASIYDITDIIIDISKIKKYNYYTEIKILFFDGYQILYSNNDDDGETIIKKIPKINDKLEILNIIAQENYEKPTFRYNEASLVNKLDPNNLNIGRPSTYVSIINKILERNYVIKSDIDGIKKKVNILSWNYKNKKINEKINEIVIGKEINKFIPTDIGILVNNFLVEHFSNVVDYKFTANMENNLDEIAKGNKIWYDILRDFYGNFHNIVISLKIESNVIDDDYTKSLGIHPKTNNKIIATIGKYGPMVKMLDENKKKYIYAPIKKPMNIDNITLENALEILEFPKYIGSFENNQMYLNIGKFGFYITHNNEKYSIGDKNTISYDDALKIIINKNKNIIWKKKVNNVIYKVFDGIYGPYINIMNNKKSTNIKIPKNININDIDINVIKHIIYNHKNIKKYKKQDKSKNI